jgi:hypothetical protein
VSLSSGFILAVVSGCVHETFQLGIYFL